MADQEDVVQDTKGSEESKLKATESHKLSREEREDFIHSLEHIVTVGSSIRHTAKRAEEWERKEQAKIQENILVVDKNEEEDGKRRALLPPMMHAEDVRMYGKNGYRRSNWPAKTRAPRKDTEWDNGDCIHPLAFLEARLSDMPPLKRQRVDGSNLSTDKTDCSVALEEVPRAMLARCWERAVHAASTRIDCDDTLGEQAEVASSSHSHSATLPEERNAKYSFDGAVKKCQDLNIHIKPSDKRQTCPACDTVFDSREGLCTHFFGKMNPAQRGCCWTKIRTTQYKLLDQILQKEVKEAADGLLKTIRQSIDKPAPHTEADGEPSRPHCWLDVIRILESTCDSARIHEAPADSTQETMQHESQKGLIALNPLVLRNAKFQSIDRYAGSPW